MKHTILTVVLAGTVAGPAWAQGGADRYQERNEGGRYSADAQGIPSGYLPAPGTCRVWYDGRPPGHQPRAKNRRQSGHPDRRGLRGRSGRSHHRRQLGSGTREVGGGNQPKLS